MASIQKILIRKGSENEEFKKIVEESVQALKAIDRNSIHFDKDFLAELRKNYPSYSPKTEVKIFKNYNFAFDAYDNDRKIAIEIEKSEIKYIWKIMCKFIVGAREKKINYAILIVPMKYAGKKVKKPTRLFNEAIRITKFISDILWIKNIAIIGLD
jgi:hypothetical protein